MADDYAIRPTAPELDYTPQELEAIASVEDKRTSEAYFHSAWGKVEEMIIEAIGKYDQKPDKSLLAEEYKIKAVADEQTAAELKTILQRIKDAVQAVESDRQRTERTEGGS